MARAALGALDAWPMHHFYHQLSRSSESPACVLLTTGAMNPPHRGHAQLLHQARERLEEAGYQVWAAWMSPSHDGYVGPKAKSKRTLHLSSKLRLHLAQLMVFEDPFVAVGHWEASVKGRWPDFPEVAEELQRTLKQLVDEQLEAVPALVKLLGESGWPRVFYACGTDHAERCGLYDGFGRFREQIGVVVVPRESELPEPERIPEVFVARPAPGEICSFSSTKIRESFHVAGIDEHAYLCNAICEAAADVMLRPSREQCLGRWLEFQSDFEKLRLSEPSCAP
ncbi:Nicotinamide/nicotinic acid mononucleotide adenylyltransferase (NMN/NaMN adenylyltransferase) (Nicotinamide mononucleotide adenylyltransferase) (NMN adenylyltransferase) (Nicotinate-nucleotide adenylyltransferase) (NaMN adenylyltransferase) [Durusdinium trenchii]|uniref:Cytidyltransferase-like domain-containing protein n=1 Tax=Durusdinium trenchii TaxID=1381693 RepID=A0ABP0M0G8_9DINO